MQREVQRPDCTPEVEAEAPPPEVDTVSKAWLVGRLQHAIDQHPNEGGAVRALLRDVEAGRCG